MFHILVVYINCYFLQMSNVVDKLRRGVAKTIQAASENEVYDSLPDCDDLLLANKFTIKIY